VKPSVADSTVLIQMACSSFNKLHISLKIILLLMTLAPGCAPRSYTTLKPEVKASRAGVDITNKNDFIYPRVTVFVKGYFYAEAGDIAAGQTLHIAFDKFKNDEGQRFDIQTMKPEVIRVRMWFDGKAVSKNFEVK
jgi:hypothetical protein